VNIIIAFSEDFLTWSQACRGNDRFGEDLFIQAGEKNFRVSEKYKVDWSLARRILFNSSPKIDIKAYTKPLTSPVGQISRLFEGLRWVEKYPRALEVIEDRLKREDGRTIYGLALFRDLLRDLLQLREPNDDQDWTGWKARGETSMALIAREVVLVVRQLHYAPNQKPKLWDEKASKRLIKYAKKAKRHREMARYLHHRNRHCNGSRGLFREIRLQQYRGIDEIYIWLEPYLGHTIDDMEIFIELCGILCWQKLGQPFGVMDFVELFNRFDMVDPRGERWLNQLDYKFRDCHDIECRF
jgi:hypothetical protein